MKMKMVFLEFCTKMFGKPFLAQKISPVSIVLNLHLQAVSEGASHPLLPPSWQILRMLGKVFSSTVVFHRLPTLAWLPLVRDQMVSLKPRDTPWWQVACLPCLTYFPSSDLEFPPEELTLTGCSVLWVCTFIITTPHKGICCHSPFANEQTEARRV